MAKDNRCWTEASRKAWADENPAYPLWRSMLRRCGQKGTPTERERLAYADCGIRVCDEWCDYETFVRWLEGQNWRPKSGLNVSRLDKAGGYGPDNCVVISHRENQRLKRNAIHSDAERRRRNKAAIRNWYAEHPLYATWHDMLRVCGMRPGRTDYQKEVYRGVTVCKEWASDYTAFESWALANGWVSGMQVARIRKDGPYSPENCIVTTWNENVNMRRNTLRVDGRTLRGLIGEPTAGRLDRRYRRVRDRIVKCGWDVADALEC